MLFTFFSQKISTNYLILYTYSIIMKNQGFSERNDMKVNSSIKQIEKNTNQLPYYFSTINNNFLHINVDHHIDRIYQHHKNTKLKDSKGCEDSQNKKLRFHSSTQQMNKYSTKQSQANIQKIEKIKSLSQQLVATLSNSSQIQLGKLEFLNPLREILIKLDQNRLKKNKNKNKESNENIKKNNFRDLAKFYAQIIDQNPTYTTLLLELKSQLSSNQFQNLQQLHKKMSKGGAKNDIILYRKSSQTVKNILDQINKGSELHHRIMLSDKNLQVKMQLLSRLEQMFLKIRELEESILK